MRCSQCNTKLNKKNKFCPGCGTFVVLDGKTAIKSNTSRSIRILVFIGFLCLFAMIFAGILMYFGGIRGVNIFFTDKGSASTMAFANNPDAISNASKSVVKLNCYDKNGKLYATGSGFACLADNIIVTNYHVIADGVYSIEASTEEGEKIVVKYVLIADKISDVAILATATPHNLPLLQLGNSYSLRKGEKVVAIGSPLGLLNSVSTGVFSGYTDENGMEVLQFTASISNGSSGGALFNDAGEVLGITYASYEDGQNLNLAIPIAHVERIWHSKTDTKMTVAEFYDLQIPEYSLDFVMSHYTELATSTFYVDGWLSTFDRYYLDWLYCANSAEDVYYPKTGGKDGYTYDRERSMRGNIARAECIDRREGVSLKLGDHIRLLCIGINEPTYFDGEMITSYALQIASIEKLD